MIAIVNLITYKIDYYTTWTLQSNGQLTWRLIFFTYLSSQTKGLNILSAVFVSIMNYGILVILIVLNVLIYIELRHIMEAKKRLVIAKSTTTRLSVANLDSVLSNVGTTPAVPRMIRFESKRGSSVAPAELMILSSPEDKAKEFLTRALIMAFWTSFIISVNRLVKVSYRSLQYWYDPNSIYTYYLYVLSSICDMIVYSSFIFIYMRTNKLFRKKFYQIILRRK